MMTAFGIDHSSDKSQVRIEKADDGELVLSVTEDKTTARIALSRDEWRLLMHWVQVSVRIVDSMGRD